MDNAATDSDWDADSFEDDDNLDTAVAESVPLSRKERLDIRRKLEDRLEQKRLQKCIDYFDESWID